MDGTGSIFDSNHGNGKRASLKDQSLLLGAMMKMLTSPQVGIAAMRQLGSCIIVYTSVAAQALEMSAAALEGSLPLPSVFSNDTGDMFSLLLKDFVAGLFWVFLLGLCVLLTLEGYRCTGDGAARCVSLTLRARGLRRGGHVLGLRTATPSPLVYIAAYEHAVCKRDTTGGRGRGDVRSWGKLVA